MKAVILYCVVGIIAGRVAITTVHNRAAHREGGQDRHIGHQFERKRCLDVIENDAADPRDAHACLEIDARGAG